MSSVSWLWLDFQTSSFTFLNPSLTKTKPLLQPHHTSPGTTALLSCQASLSVFPFASVPLCKWISQHPSLPLPLLGPAQSSLPSTGNLTVLPELDVFPGSPRFSYLQAYPDIRNVPLCLSHSARKAWMAVSTACSPWYPYNTLWKDKH